MTLYLAEKCFTRKPFRVDVNVYFKQNEFFYNFISVKGMTANREEIEAFLGFLDERGLSGKKINRLVPQLSSKTLRYIQRDLAGVTAGAPGAGEPLFIFTDGNCRGNGKSSARGAWGIFITSDENSPYYRYNRVERVREAPTNQKCELTAILYAFKMIRRHPQSFAGRKITICTDSLYSINCITKWSDGWKRKGWRTAKGETVKNLELIQAILDERDALSDGADNVEFKHVFSHTAPPSDKDSRQYMFWNGNHIVDSMINDLLDDRRDDGRDDGRDDCRDDV
jgi:ribonuclease HI